MLRSSLLLVLVLVTAPACVTVYQPVASLQRPVTVDPSAPNLDGLRLLVRCIPSEGADQSESDELCQNMSQLYSNQGAKVSTEVPDEEGIGVNRTEAQDAEEWAQPGQAAKGKDPSKPDLIIELKARRVHGENSPVLWALCIATFTLVPAITEATFAQDVMIRDAEGFLLASETLQARFIRYFGLAFWGINGLLDLIVRPKGEGLTGNNHNRDFSKDFHGQMSQLAFHAVLRQRILQSFAGETEPVRPEAPPAKQAPPGKPAPGKLQDSGEKEWLPPPPPPSSGSR